MNTNDIPIWQKYTLSIEEASRYFRIGEKKLRRLAEENPDANWLIMNGNRLRIKRNWYSNIIETVYNTVRIHSHCGDPFCQINMKQNTWQSWKKMLRFLQAKSIC